jgi:hypothetical protein
VCKQCRSGKAINITYSECVFVAVVIPHNAHAPYLRPSPLHYFSTLSHKRHDFRKKFMNIKCVFWFSLQNLSETVLILRRYGRDIIIHVYTYCSLCKIIFIFVICYGTWILLTDFRKTSNLMKIRPVGAGVFHTDWRTDREKYGQTWRS